LGGAFYFPGTIFSARRVMSDVTAPKSAGQIEGSLWTTPAKAADCLPLDKPLVDTAVSAEKIRAAAEATSERVAAFSGKVSDEVLRTGVGSGERRPAGNPGRGKRR
jgi:hypothetical protein